MILPFALVLSMALAVSSFYSTGFDAQVDAGVMEDYYFTLSNNNTENSTWFNITMPFQVDYGQTDPPTSVEGNTLCYNVSIGPAESATVKIRARASTPASDQNFSLTTAYDYGQDEFNQTVKAPMITITNYSFPGKVLANQVFEVNFTILNKQDSDHTGVLYSVSGLTQPTTDFSVLEYSSILSILPGNQASSRIKLKAPSYTMNKTLQHTIYSLVDPFTYKTEFNTSVKSVYPSLAITVYNDSALTVPATEFLPNQTVYFQVSVTDPDDNSPISGNLSIRVYDNDSALVFLLQNFTFEQNASYSLNATAVSGTWTITAVEQTSNSSSTAHFKVKPVISGLMITTCRTSPCANNTEHFAPSDTLYAVVSPVDQAGKPLQDEYNTSITVTADWNNSLSYQDQGTGELSVTLPGDHGFLTINASAWNNQSNTSKLKHIDIPLFTALGLSPAQPYNYGQQVCATFFFTDVDGNTADPDEFNATVQDDSGAYYNTSQHSFCFNISGTVNNTELQQITASTRKQHYNNTGSWGLSVTNQLAFEENVSDEYGRGETADLSFMLLHANTQAATANVTVTLTSPSGNKSTLYSGETHSENITFNFNYTAETGEWTVNYTALDAHENNATLERKFNVSANILQLQASFPEDGLMIAGVPFNITVKVYRNSTLAGTSADYCINTSCQNMLKTGQGIFTTELNLSEGTYQFKANATDEYANTGNTSFYFTVYSPPNITAELFAPNSVYAGQAFTVTLKVNNTGQATANVTAFFNSQKNVLIPSGGSHEFSWQETIQSPTTLTVTLSWQTGNMSLSRTVSILPSGGSSYSYIPYYPEETEEPKEQETGNETRQPEDALNMRVTVPQEGKEYYNPVMISVYSNAESCFILPSNQAIKGSKGFFLAYKNFSTGINTLQVRCVKADKSITESVTFTVIKEKQKQSEEQKPVLPAHEPSKPEKGTRLSGASVLNPSLAAGLAFAAGVFVFALGLRVISPRVRKKYPLQGYSGWRKWL